MQSFLEYGKLCIHTARDWDRNQWVLICYEEMFTLVGDRDRYQGPLFRIVQVPFPLPPTVPVPCSVNKPYRIVSPVNFPQITSFTGRIHIKLLTRCHSFLSQNWALFHNMLNFYISSSKRLGNRSLESNKVTTAHYGIASGRVWVQSVGSFTKKTA